MENESPRLPESSPPEEWRLKASRGGRLAVAATSLAAVCSIAAWGYALGRPVAIDSFVAVLAGLAGLLLALLLGIFAAGYYSLRYRLSEGELVLRWLWVQEIIPLGRVDGVYGGHRLGKPRGVEGMAWPGLYRGRAGSESFPQLQYHGTSLDPADAIILTTPDGAYALTPADLDGFRSALIARLEALPQDAVAEAPPIATRMPAWLCLSILRDGVTIALLAGALLVMLVSFGYVAARFPQLPELMPLHFGFTGEPDVIGPPRDAFRMPVIAMVLLGANSLLVTALHRNQRDAARMLAGATVFVQLVMLVAVFRVVH